CVHQPRLKGLIQPRTEPYDPGDRCREKAGRIDDQLVQFISGRHQKRRGFRSDPYAAAPPPAGLVDHRQLSLRDGVCHGEKTGGDRIMNRCVTDNAGLPQFVVCLRFWVASGCYREQRVESGLIEMQSAGVRVENNGHLRAASSSIVNSSAMRLKSPATCRSFRDSALAVSVYPRPE